MPGTQKSRPVATCAKISHFDHQAVNGGDAAVFRLTLDPFDAIRLPDLLIFTRDRFGRLRGICRAISGRITQNARKIIADVIVSGKEVSSDGGSSALTDKSGANPT